MSAGNYKTVRTAEILKFIESATKLAKATINDPRYARLSADTMTAILEAAEALTEATAARLLVDVPDDIKQRLEEIYNLLKTNEREVARLQGIVLARSDPMQNVQSTPYRADTRRGRTPSSTQSHDQYQTLLDMVKDLTRK